MSLRMCLPACLRQPFYLKKIRKVSSVLRMLLAHINECSISHSSVSMSTQRVLFDRPDSHSSLPFPLSFWSSSSSLSLSLRLIRRRFHLTAYCPLQSAQFRAACSSLSRLSPLIPIHRAHLPLRSR